MKNDIPDSELERRVIYSLLSPSVRLARIFGIPLKEMKSWLGIAYLHEMKRAGMTQNECADRMDVSRRTIIDLSKRLKENFFKPEQHAGLSRKILFILWAEPTTRGRLLQAIDEDDEEIERALDLLVKEEQIVCDETQPSTTYRLNKSAFRLYSENWIARVDALNHQLNVLSDTVFGRFFRADKRAFVRSIGLSVRQEDSDELEAFYRDVVFPKLQALDDASSDDPNAELLEFSISWVPRNLIQQYEKEQ